MLIHRVSTCFKLIFSFEQSLSSFMYLDPWDNQPSAGSWDNQPSAGSWDNQPSAGSN